jgi:hypothetical protein
MGGLKKAGYAADVLLEVVEGQFVQNEPSTDSQRLETGTRSANPAGRIVAEWSSFVVRRSCACMELGWKLAYAQSLAAAAAHQLRYNADCLSDLRQTMERVFDGAGVRR